jgi:OmpA-OmpF porin, OOP family
MTTIRKTVLAALAAVLVAGWSPASLAQLARGGPDSGFYVGAAIGQAQHKESCADVPSGAICDDKDTAWRILGGWQLNRHFAAEIAYTDFGEIFLSAGGIEQTVEETAWELVAVGTYPFPEGFSLYGKLGLYRAKSEGRTNIGISASDTNSDVTFGVGGRYDFNRNVGVRVEWQRYSDVGGGDFEKDDIDVVSVGVFWKF